MQDIGRDTIVDDRYRVEDLLGSGGMAEVWSAQDGELGRRVALKILSGRLASDPEFHARFRREASAAAVMQHPNIVAIYDRGDWDGTSYIAMEMVDGQTLKHLVREHGPLGPGPATDIAIEILKALRYAHKRGVVHRDVKPQNVLVDGEGQIKVADFGIAHAVGSDMTQADALLGTVQYVSPEQAKGQPVSPRSDLYSVGIVLYEMLTSRVPFDGNTPIETSLRQINEPPLPPSQLRPGLPASLEHVVMRALEKDPERRYASADDFIIALETARRAPAQRVVLEPTPGEPWDEGERGERRPPWWAWAIGAAVVAAAVVLAVLLLSSGKEEVPSLVGEPSAQVAPALHKVGLEPRFVNDYSDDVPNGRVISQSPQSGSQVPKGSVVTVHVSAGPESVAVPHVVGLQVDAAEALVEAAGLKPARQDQFSDTVPSGEVILSTPSEGQTLARGKVVLLTVSGGREHVTIPNLVGLTKADAQRRLRGLGLQADFATRETTHDRGLVLAQDRKAGSVVDKGETVTLTIATERPQVPDVTTGNPQRAAAERRLQNAGYRVTARGRPGPAALVGRVVAQSPAAGARRSSGATVTIVVGTRAAPTPTPTPTRTPKPTPTAKPTRTPTATRTPKPTPSPTPTATPSPTPTTAA